MEYSLSNSLVGGSGSINPDALSLDLQFATDKTLTARRGPIPVFTRGSGDNGGTTYFAPASINVSFVYLGANITVDVSQTTVLTNNRWEWQEIADFLFYYNGTAWVFQFEGNLFATSAPTTAYRPDLANWSGSGTTVAATSTFGIVRAANNEPRFDHDPVTLACKGLLIEEQRQNILLNSDALSTQSVTVTAIAHTLSFYGTGTIVLSGTAIATVTGSGAFPTRTTYTFTPTAGTLILTVTGSVRYANLERVNSSSGASFATSYIPTTSTSVTRSTDVCSISSNAFSSMYNATEGTFVTQTKKQSTSINSFVFHVTDGTFNNASDIRYSSITNVGALINVSNVSQLTGFSATITSGSYVKQSLAYKLNDCAYSANGGTVATDSTVSIPSVNRLNIGGAFTTGYELNGTISSIRYFRKRLPNEKLQTLTT